MRFLLTLSLLLGSLFLLQNCSEPCDDVDCGENGTCVEGICNCDTGYSGANCQVNVCDSVDCGENGTCDLSSGACLCDEGYEGERCETEFREKYYGTFIGDMVPCIPGIISSFIPDDIKTSLEMTSIELTSSDQGIFFVNLTIGSELIGFEIDVDLNAEEFIVPFVEEEIDISGLTATVSGDGTGRIVDTNNIQLELELKVKSGFIEADSECTVQFTK